MNGLCASQRSAERKICLQCRICGSDRIVDHGHVEFYVGYAWPIYDCNDCGCRFTLHDSSTYDLLYSERSSCYSRYLGLAETCKTLFDRGDLAGLRAELSRGSKYRFVIDQIDHEPVDSRILEIGSSRGHLTSYFILGGRRITGVDISPTAVASAARDFGDHFVQAGDPSIDAKAPYDVIFHVGTIGCVADPVGMTGCLLDLLKSGGRLLFNAPNRNACSLRDQLWFESAPPPDVVTLFSPGFWRDHFAHIARVTEETEFRTPEQNLLIALRKLTRRKWRNPLPMALSESGRWSTPPVQFADAVWLNVERAVRKVVQWSGLLPKVPGEPAEFGLFVQMRKM